MFIWIHPIMRFNNNYFKFFNPFNVFFKKIFSPPSISIFIKKGLYLSFGYNFNISFIVTELIFPFSLAEKDKALGSFVLLLLIAYFHFESLLHLIFSQPDHVQYFLTII